MENNMTFSYGGLGAGITKTIRAPEIDKYCPNCQTRMILIDGRGLINSGTHTFLAQCPECGITKKFKNYDLWKNLWKKWVKKETKQRENEE